MVTAAMAAHTAEGEDKRVAVAAAAALLLYLQSQRLPHWQQQPLHKQ